MDFSYKKARKPINFQTESMTASKRGKLSFDSCFLRICESTAERKVSTNSNQSIGPRQKHSITSIVIIVEDDIEQSKVENNNNKKIPYINRIGHLRVAFRLCFRPGAHPFMIIWK